MVKKKKRLVKKKGVFGTLPALSKLDHFDILLIKVSVFTLALWLATLFPEEIAPYGQYFFAVFLIASIRPFYRCYIK